MKPFAVTSGLEIAGHRIIRNVGVVRGIVVRSRSIIGRFMAGLQTIFGGNITVYTNLCERARMDAYNIMCQHADKHGANAVISVRYDTTEIMSGVTEVLCYGTAVVIEEAGAKP
ncbi:MAG: YbjQ family protein [Alphaproteobacteria bacterium]